MVKIFAQELSSMGQPVSLASVMRRLWSRARRALSPQSPYRIGDAVVGDDPFNGRREGVVVFQRGTSVGVKTAQGLLHYDHRQLKQLD